MLLQQVAALNPRFRDLRNARSMAFVTRNARAIADLQERARAHLGADGPEPPRFDAGEGMVKTSAAWLIDKAGFTKGFGLPGEASLSTKHTLAVTNRGGATAEDVLALAGTVRDGVHEAFGVTLVNEPVLVNLSLPTYLR